MVDGADGLVARLRDAAMRDDVPRADVVTLLLEAANEIESEEASFKLRWDADMRAIKRWQEAHPGNDDVWPDHVDLVVWLMGKLEDK